VQKKRAMINERAPTEHLRGISTCGDVRVKRKKGALEDDMLGYIMSSKVSSKHMDMCQSWDRLQAL
jgi:hypothetical protein